MSNVVYCNKHDLTDNTKNVVLSSTQLDSGIIYARDDEDDASKRTVIKQEHHKYQHQQQQHSSLYQSSEAGLAPSQNSGSSSHSNSRTPQYTVKVGDTVVIPCIIENRKQATVIWQYSKSRIPETLTGIKDIHLCVLNPKCQFLMQK